MALPSEAVDLRGLAVLPTAHLLQVIDLRKFSSPAPPSGLVPGAPWLWHQGLLTLGAWLCCRTKMFLSSMPGSAGPEY